MRQLEIQLVTEKCLHCHLKIASSDSRDAIVIRGRELKVAKLAFALREGGMAYSFSPSITVTRANQGICELMCTEWADR